MIRRLLFRGPAPAADRVATEAEAQRAYRLVLDEARVERIQELERQLAAERAENERLRNELRIARVVERIPQWMDAHHQIRAARLDGMKTSVVPASLVRKLVKGHRR